MANQMTRKPRIPRGSSRGPRQRPRFWRLRAVARLSAEFGLSLADRLVVKRPKRVLIGCDNGTGFDGNARTLFQYLKSSGRGEAYFVTRSPEATRAIERQFPGSTLHPRSWAALRLGLSSASLCMTHTRADLGVLKYLRGPRFVYLTHGIPLKAMGFKKAYHDPFIERHGSSFRAITCSSEFEAALWREAYRLPEGRTWVTGAGRNDELSRNRAEDRERILCALGLDAGRRLVLFAPTFREAGVLESYLPVTGADVESLVAVLQQHNATLLVRPHPLDSQAAAHSVEDIGCPQIVLVDDALLEDVQVLLACVDILITDYSSIYLDFLKLDRPIIFACHDLEEYERDRGFMMDYRAHTPGAHVRDGPTLVQVLDAELAGEDSWAERRAQLRSLFHVYLDDQACARITDRLFSPS